MEPSPWDAKEQAMELNAWRRHQETGLISSGAALAVVNAILAFEVLSVNEDTNTILALGILDLAMIMAWIAVARRADARSSRWALKARRIEREVLRVPEPLSLWNEAPGRGLPAWLAVGAILVGFAVFWGSLILYAFWATYLRR